jgi:hypothetical protein
LCGTQHSQYAKSKGNVGSCKSSLSLQVAAVDFASLKTSTRFKNENLPAKEFGSFAPQFIKQQNQVKGEKP